jgi:hypothetical protein
MEEVKSVRVRRRLASLDERHGNLDIKVTVYKGIGKKRSVKGFNNGSIVWPESIYDGEYVSQIDSAKKETKEILINQYKNSGTPVPESLESTIDSQFSIEGFVIDDFIRVNTLRERPSEGETVEIFDNDKLTSKVVKYYNIVQDPWSDTVPVKRSFGFDPYYLSNGSEVYVKWLTESYDKMHYGITGYTSSITASGSSASVTKIVVDVTTANYDKYPDFDLKFDYNGGSQSEIDSVVDGIVEQSIEYGFNVNGINYLPEGEKIPSTLTYLMSGGEQYSDNSMNEINTPKNIIKRIEVIPPRNESGELVDKIWTLTDNNEFKYLTDVLGDPGTKQMSYTSTDKDIDIIKKMIESWSIKIPVYKSLSSTLGFGLQLCSPSYQSCLLVNYQSPLKPMEPEKTTTVTEDNITAASSSNKTKLTPVFPNDFEAKVREDVPPFKIYIGEPPVEEEGGFIFQDDMSDLEELSPEYIESKFAGDEEDEPSIQQELEQIADVTKKGEEEAAALGPLTIIPGENPFAGAKPGSTNPSENGIGYPVNSSTVNFAKKHTSGIFPAKMHPDGTFVVSSKEPGKWGKKGEPYKDRHWLVQNPEYVRRLAKVKVPMASGDKTISVHPELASKLEAAFKVIRSKGLSKYIESCAGGLAVRNVTNGLRLSNHSYGFAMDVNTTKDGWQYGAKWDVANKTIKSGGKSRSWNDFDTGFYEVVKVMKAAGIGWLGSMDPMHFSIYE